MKDIKDVVCWLEEEIEHYKDYLDVKYSYLSDIERSAGLTWSLSELICEALNLYLWAEEDNKRIEAERERAGLEKRKAG